MNKEEINQEPWDKPTRYELKNTFQKLRGKPREIKPSGGIKNNQGSIVDVRTTQEFMGGSVSGAVNIPLNEIPHRIDELKEMKAPLILCCASGNRSGQAENFLSRQGIKCLNGGSWLEVNFLTSEKV